MPERLSERLLEILHLLTLVYFATIMHVETFITSLVFKWKSCNRYPSYLLKKTLGYTFCDCFNEICFVVVSMQYENSDGLPTSRTIYVGYSLSFFPFTAGTIYENCLDLAGKCLELCLPNAYWTASSTKYILRD